MLSFRSAAAAIQQHAAHSSRTRAPSHTAHPPSHPPFFPLQDKTWRKYVKMYAADQDLFFKDFTAAYTKLTELGTKNLKPVAL